MKTGEELTLALKKADEIRNYISENGLMPGMKLPPERTLASMLCCSRNIVREALRRLEGLGLIEKRSRDGVYVAEDSFSQMMKQFALLLVQSPEDRNRLVEARRALDTIMIELVFRNASDPDIKKLDDVVKKFESAKTVEESTAADTEFHGILADIAANSFLGDFRLLLDQFFAGDDKATENTLQKNVRVHRAMVDALKRKDLVSLREVVLSTELA